MAIKLTSDTATSTLSVKASGKLSADDYHILDPGGDELSSSAGNIRILFVMHDFHGWDVGAVWEDIRFAT